MIKSQKKKKTEIKNFVAPLRRGEQIHLEAVKTTLRYKYGTRIPSETTVLCYFCVSFPTAGAFRQAACLIDN